MKCVNHFEKDATSLCNYCGKSLCSDCQAQINNETYCKGCVSIKMGQVKKEERSPILAGMLSFIIGGLGQIYNGQVGKGLLILFTSWLIIPYIIGIVDAYNTANKINRGEIITKKRTGCLITVVIGVIIFWIAVFFFALVAVITIPNLMKARIAANEKAVQNAASKNYGD